MSTEEPQNGLPSTQEAGSLALAMAAAYRGMVESYRKIYGLSPKEALEKAAEPSPVYEENLQQTPVDQASWYDLAYLTEHDPERAAKTWETMKRAALDELQSGHRAAQAVEGHCSTPWDRARFLAIRTDLAADWQPRNGIERQLIDTLALAQTQLLIWMDTLTVLSGIAAKTQKRDVNERGSWQPQRISEAEAVEQAGAMFDRFNRIFVRTVRTLQDLRRHGPKVVVQNAGQVNVGRQQVNVAENQTDAAGGMAAGQQSSRTQRKKSAALDRPANGVSNGRGIPERIAAQLGRNGDPAAH